MQRNAMTIYQQAGYRDREEYLSALAAEYSLGLEEVYRIADQLGEFEDFGGLIARLEQERLIR